MPNSERTKKKNCWSFATTDQKGGEHFAVMTACLALVRRRGGICPGSKRSQSKRSEDRGEVESRQGRSRARNTGAVSATKPKREAECRRKQKRAGKTNSLSNSLAVNDAPRSTCSMWPGVQVLCNSLYIRVSAVQPERLPLEQNERSRRLSQLSVEGTFVTFWFFFLLQDRRGLERSFSLSIKTGELQSSH